MKRKRFRIAFSFAGEKRHFVHEVATILAQRFGQASILYDKFHKAEFSRSDLAFYLPKLYHQQADLVVAVFCADYDKKEWCGLEWNAIFDLLKKGHSEQVMLTRFDHAHGKGLFSLAGYAELDQETPESTATLILERLARNEDLPKDYYAKPTTNDGKVLHTTISNNLPRLQAFYGRETELKRIAEALNFNNPTWGLLIDGPAGIGKTSLAIRAAHGCPPDQFQRIVFVSAKDRELDDDGVRYVGHFLLQSFLEMMNELARELGRLDITKAPEDQRARLLHKALGTQNVLLIFDNLESLSKNDRDQLFTFVRRLPSGSKALLTSRDRIGTISEELILERLSEDAALNTLAGLAKHSPFLTETTEAERLALYAQTGGKPLLLRWIAGQLGRGSCRTFEGAMTLLHTCPPRNDPLEFVFGDLVHDFSDEVIQVLCALSYFGLPGREEHIAPISGLTEPQVRSALDVLSKNSLVASDQKEKEFALIPLVTDFMKRLRPEAIASAGDRLEAHAYALVRENGYEYYDRFPLLNAAWPMIAAALPRFIAGSNERLQVLCEAFERFLEYTARWDEWLALTQKAEIKALTANDLWNAGRRAYNSGWLYSLRSESANVIACADRAASHWRDALAGPREQSIALHLRGNGFELAKDYTAAIKAYQDAFEIDHKLSPESIDIAIDLNALGCVKQLAGDLKGAEHDYNSALRIAITKSYREGVAYISGNLAGLALDRHDWSGAESLAREALRLSEGIGRLELIARDSRRLAEALARQERKSEGLSFAQHAVDIYTSLSSPKLEEALHTLAECTSSKE